MTEKFNHNATPKTNRNKFYLSELEIIEGSEVPVVETWFAEELERESNGYKEKLRIATDTLTRITLDDSNNFFTIMACLDALKRIEGVGK
jgi:hypothetical protein